jgi:hypothetical protein
VIVFQEEPDAIFLAIVHKALEYVTPPPAGAAGTASRGRLPDTDRLGGNQIGFEDEPVLATSSGRSVRA